MSARICLKSETVTRQPARIRPQRKNSATAPTLNEIRASALARFLYIGKFSLAAELNHFAQRIYDPNDIAGRLSAHSLSAEKRPAKHCEAMRGCAEGDTPSAKRVFVHFWGAGQKCCPNAAPTQ